ncbi:MAG: SpoIID/LytB domain-containing protein [Lachnospiraceae bacterium]|nr:SpoIID/LytB domain-containing protein [Lachnospiraceae bacterium]
MRKRDAAKKAVLIVVCVVIIAGIFVRNIMGGTGRTASSDYDKTADVANEKVTRAEAFRLFSYLMCSKEERDSFERETAFTDLGQKDRYEPYINAAAVTGLIDGKDSEIRPYEEMTCGEFRDLLFRAVDLLKIDYKALAASFPERFKSVKEEEKVLLSEVLAVFENICELAKDSDGAASKLGTETVCFLDILNEDATEEDRKVAADNGVQYYFSGYEAYEPFFITNAAAENGILTVDLDKGMDAYLDKKTVIFASEDEIIYIKEVRNEVITLPNVWMEKAEGTTIKAYVQGIEREFETSLPISETVEEEVADLTMQDGKITRVVVKPDKINGKVLLTSETEVEIEGYGTLPLDENFMIYKIYGTLGMEKTKGILVGYTITDFVVSEGKVCAALVKEGLTAENIRVLISTSNFESLFHQSVTLTADCGFTIYYGDYKKRYEAKEAVTIAKSDEMLAEGRLKVVPDDAEGKIILHSITRAYGYPEYRGTMEIARTQKGLTVINELSLEEYLYAVVPSEMPTSYGSEALKVQAVCARSYAYNQLVANRYSEYGAHVDDSVNCQVYNNLEENEDSILAVKDTYGRVLIYDNKILTAYYFSTSFGHTASIEDVWENGQKTEYLTGALQTDLKQQVDLSDESSFRDFVMGDSVAAMSYGTEQQIDGMQTYDSEYQWYRWHVTISKADLSNHINQNLYARYKASPSSILTLAGDAEAGDTNGYGVRVIDGKVYKSMSISSIGTVTGMKVMTRGNGGIIKELLITGTKNSVLVCYQTNVRTLLAPVSSVVYRMDESTVTGMTLLPSAFFFIDPVERDGAVTAFTLTGGGYGHGVGMSQNGVKAMTDKGKTYEEVLKHYYAGVTIGILYE